MFVVVCAYFAVALVVEKKTRHPNVLSEKSFWEGLGLALEAS